MGDIREELFSESVFDKADLQEFWCSGAPIPPTLGLVICCNKSDLFDRYLAEGLPISNGFVEGACRIFVKGDLCTTQATQNIILFISKF